VSSEPKQLANGEVGRPREPKYTIRVKYTLIIIGGMLRGEASNVYCQGLVRYLFGESE
jgi:hypothetical protein